MTQNITSALMVAAFEIACYEKPDMTLEEMNMEFGKYMMIGLYLSTGKTEGLYLH